MYLDKYNDLGYEPGEYITFYEWVTQYQGENTHIIDLGNDISNDPYFPRLLVGYKALYDYLVDEIGDNMGSNEKVFNALLEAYSDYQDECNGKCYVEIEEEETDQGEYDDDDYWYPGDDTVEYLKSIGKPWR